MIGRRKSVSFPRVWAKFERRLADGSLKKFRIQEIPEDLFDNVVRFMDEFYSDDEPFSLAAEINKNTENLKTSHFFWKNYLLPRNVSFVCLEEKPEDVSKDLNGEPLIIAVSFLIHKVKGREEKPPGHDEPQIIVDMLEEIYSRFSIYEKYGVDQYITGCGMAVRKSYQGMKIGLELLNARTPLCQAMGIKVTDAIFSVVSSQKLAARAGFEVVIEIEYEELSRLFPEAKFPKSFQKFMVMAKTIE